MMVGKNKGSVAVAERIPEDSVGVEIGVWRGDTSALFLATGKVRVLHLVDPWSVLAFSAQGGDFERYAKLVGSTDPEEFQRYYDRVYEGVTTRFASDDRVRIWRLRSAVYWYLLENDPAVERPTWCYIDGGHDYVTAFNDICAAARLGMRTFGDDYGNKPGVTQAVDEFVGLGGVALELLGGNQWEIVRASE